MKCDCCGRRKKLMESYVDLLGTTAVMHICSGCNDLLLGIRESFLDGDKKNNIRLKTKLCDISHSHSKDFVTWEESFFSKYCFDYNNSDSD